ncbi:hypothetical protein EYF80_010200 [Liparis tanakae]|uniref:Uncharacterized protein n=1 Tax=Liparis tanakae TaxID=230148 RepID=A0A4Z2IPM2_9TELE|nr:hypothetical protein EYF80_010200 [Liparis tanakae]
MKRPGDYASPGDGLQRVKGSAGMPRSSDSSWRTCLCSVGTWLALASSSFTLPRPLSSACLASSTFLLMSTCSLFRVRLQSSRVATVSLEVHSSCSILSLHSMASSTWRSLELRSSSISWMMFCRLSRLLKLFWVSCCWWASQTAGVAALKCRAHVLDELAQTCVFVFQLRYPVLGLLQRHYLLVALLGAGPEPAAGGVPPSTSTSTTNPSGGCGALAPGQKFLSPPQGAPKADLSFYVLAVLPDQQPAVLVLAPRLCAEVPAQLGVEVSEGELAGQVVQDAGALRVLRVFV